MTVIAFDSYRACPTCDELIGRTRDCEACQQHRRHHRVISAGVPVKLRAVTFADVDREGRETAVAAHQALVRGETRGVYTEGNVGTGKTFLAAVAFGEVLREAPGLWISAPSAVLTERGGFSDQRTELLEALNSEGPLVIDDIDKAPRTANAAGLLFTAIDRRVNSDAPLIVTSNMSLHGLATYFPDRYGEAIASRLAGHCAQVEIFGADRRLGEAA